MAARKLQTEIDRTLKKVAEGVELFESIYDKMQASTNQTQKEKLELDLKTQIKKLQRLRDQIKTWVANNDVKDKSQLLENRRLIETQMEKFKACEKEMKTKAFSKEGLIQAAKLDPKEQEKEEVTLWLQSQVEELQMQVEQTEAEVEALQGTGKKRNKGSSITERLGGLEYLNERRKYHIGRLEIILRLLNNGSLSTDRILELKEDVSYFVESNTEEGFEEDTSFYDVLNLDEEEEKFGLAFEDNNDTEGSEVVSEDVPARATKKHDEESVTSSKRDESPVMKKASVTLQLRKPIVASEPKPPPNPNFSQQTLSSIVKANLPPPTAARPPALPPIKYAAAAAAAVAPAPNTQGNSTQVSVHSATPTQLPPLTPLVLSNPSPVPPLPPITSSATQMASQDHQSGVSSSPSLTHPSVTSPMLSSASLSHQHDGSFYSGQESPALSEAVPSSLGGPAATSSPQRMSTRKDSVSSMSRPGTHAQGSIPSLSSELPAIQPIAPLSQTAAQLPALSPLPQQVQQHVTSTAGLPSTNGTVSIAPAPPQSHPQFPPGVKVPPLSTVDQTNVANAVSQQQQQQPQNAVAQRPPSAAATQQQTTAGQRSTSSAGFPGSLSDLVMSFENVKQKAAHRMTNLDQVHKLLESGYSNAPQPQDTEKPKYYVPRNPYQTPSYYPQSPNPVLSTAGIFSQLDVETLFYVFYFLPGTYQQYLAAKELKRQSWRFHVKYLTWFQRHSEPQAITEEYEQGVYVYFDWEGSWCQRKKSDFRFEYRYLSED